MSKYIGTPVVSLVTDTVDVTGDITTTDATPEVIIVNDTSEDTDGGREGKVTFKGQQSGGEETTLAQIQASHDGTSDDEKGDLIFRTNDGSDGASPTEAMRIDSSQNIGIGTSSPNGYANYNVLTIDGTSGGVLDLERSGTLTGEIYVGADQLIIDAVGSSSFLNFQTNSTERMRIRSDGIVSINDSTDPTAGGFAPKLHLKQGTDGVFSGFTVEGHNSDVVGGFGYSAANNALAIGVSYRSTGGYKAIDLMTSGAIRMRVNTSGGVSFGNTSFSAASGNIMVNEGVYVGATNGDNQIRSSSAGGGSATLYIGNAAIQVSSDQRLKTNIIDTTMTAVNKINQVRVVDFNWDDPSDTSYNNRNARGTWTGVIAQELIDIFPFAVNAPRNEDDLTIDNDSDTKWQVDQGNLVPVLIKAIQELSAKVTTLETQNTTQATQIADLITRVETLEGE